VNRNKSANIRKQLLDLIAEGQLKPGDRVWSENEIVSTFGTSLTTANRVLSQLAMSGYIERIQGKGSFVKRANGLSRNRPSIGLIVPDVTSSFYADMISECEVEARNAGVLTVFANTRDNPVVEAEFLAMLREEHASGLILVASKTTFQNRELIAELAQETPVVVVDLLLDGIEADFVVNDNEDGGFQAATHLLSIGRRRILHLAGDEGNSAAEGRLQGYRRALREWEIQVDRSLVVRTGWTEQCGYDAVHAALKQGREFDAVFAACDAVAAGAITALEERQIVVPSSVAVVGFANQTEYLVRGFSITTVDQHSQKLGAKAIELLIEATDEKANRTSKRTWVLPTALLVRRSTQDSDDAAVLARTRMGVTR